MKKIAFSLVMLISLSVLAQQKKDEPIMDNWFAKKPTAPPPAGPPNPPNGVPLDGGLVALIAAGGAVGYKKYKDRKKTE